MNAIYNVLIVRLGEYMVRKQSPITRLMVKRLVESIGRRLKREGIKAEIRAYTGRIIVEPRGNDLVRTRNILAKIFGISSISPAVETENELFTIIERITSILRILKPRSISVRVSGEPLGISKRELLWIITDRLKKELNIRYDLVKPDISIGIDLREDKAYIYTEEYRGPGGLPYGVEGCLITLVSGGIDSAVAAWYTMKRGVRIIPLYIDYGEYWPPEAHERFNDMIRRLYIHVPWDTLTVLRVRGVEEILLKADIPDRLRCLFCKANMYRIAGYAVEDYGCKGISTGESIGQVASQTLQNLDVITRLSKHPIYRPLAFVDKLEIIETGRMLGFGGLAKRIDSCMLKPLHPETSASSKDYEILRKALEETEELARTIYRENLEVTRLH